MNTIYNETQVVESLYQEYLSTVNRYRNLKRPSCFVKYFNINYDLIPYDSKVDSTYDTYNYSQVLFDLFEFTPAFYMTPVTNNSIFVNDLRGSMLDGVTTLTTYTIDRPRVNDLIIFYDPIKTGEMFRVVNFRTSTNALRSDPALNWFELDLEYAPILEIGNLKLNETYYYDLTLQQNLLKDSYLDRIEHFSILEDLFTLISPYYDKYLDLYCYGDSVPLIVNELIIYYKKYHNHDYHRIFESLYSPYGYIDKLESMTFNSIDELPLLDPDADDITLDIYSISNQTVEPYSVVKTDWEESADLNNLIYLAFQIYKEYIAYNETTNNEN